MQEQLQTLTLEEAFAHELAKDVKLKGGGTAIDPDTGQPLKPAKAIAMSIMQQALKGDIAASCSDKVRKQNAPARKTATTIVCEESSHRKPAARLPPRCGKTSETASVSILPES